MSEMIKGLAPIHPGEILVLDFLLHGELLAASVFPALRDLPRIEAILMGRSPITRDIAVRLNMILGPSLEFWMGLQAAYDAKTR